MACTKTALVSAINSYAAARASGDGNLINFSGNLVTQFIETLEFEKEEEETEADDNTTD